MESRICGIDETGVKDLKRKRLLVEPTQQSYTRIGVGGNYTVHLVRDNKLISFCKFISNASPVTNQCQERHVDIT